MNNPLVSVICLCYNQMRFVKETLDSVIDQTYENIQVIIVDDGSTDESKEVICRWLHSFPRIPFLNLEINVGNTTAFNQGLTLARGKYIIDLACDDILDSGRVARQVAFFEQQSRLVGVIYSNVTYIDERGILIGGHFQGGRFTPFQGDVFARVIDTYFISPPSMMIKKVVLDELKGYDENLAYEDFDFWVRSARNWEYAFQKESLTKVRKVSHSLSANYGGVSDLQMASTLIVCRKIKELIRSPSEEQALVFRLKYEIKQSFLLGRKAELRGFLTLWQSVSPPSFMFQIIYWLSLLSWKWHWLKRLKAIFIAISQKLEN